MYPHRKPPPGRGLDAFSFFFFDKLGLSTYINRGIYPVQKSLGFTLIELWVVVLIIGILSAVALPQYTKAVEKSRSAEMLSFVSSAKKAVSMWLLENGGLPSSETELLKAGLLDIDMAASLDCEGASAWDCSSKNWRYNVFCTNTTCSINFYRDNEGSGNYYKGYLDTEDGNSWTGYCVYESSLGKPICESFAAFGDVTVESL